MTPRDTTVLEIAARRYRHPGARIEAIRVELGMSETRFAQVLGSLLEDVEAEREHPALVRRLRRLRDGRRSARG